MKKLVFFNRRMRRDSENRFSRHTRKDLLVCVLLAGGMLFALNACNGGGSPKIVYTVNDEFDALRVKCIEYMTGGSDYDPNNENISFALTHLASTAEGYWNSMLKEPESCLWNELKYNPNGNSSTYGTLSRINAMCIAYSTPGCSLYANKALLDDILMAMEFVGEKMFHIGKTINSADWWSAEVGCSQAMGYVLMFIYEYLTPEQLQKWCDIFDYWNPNDVRGAYYKSWGLPNGTNMTNRCVAVMMRAICSKDAELLEKVRVSLNGTFFYANGINARGTDLEDGYYTDGSYLLHVGLAHTGGYGSAHLENLPFLINVLSNTKWALDQEKINMTWDWIYNTYIPVMYKGGLFSFVKDRVVSRSGSQPYRAGHNIASALCGLALAAPEPHKSYFQGVVKGWVQENSFLDFFSYIHTENQRMFMAATIRMEQLMSNENIKPVTDFTMGRMFGVAARAVSFRPGYAFGVAMNCSRMKYYETIHGESLKSWYFNEGMTFFVNDDDLTQYDDNYWATVNWYRLPGITVDTKERANQEGGSTSNNYIYSRHHWAGGVALGDRYVATGYHMDAYNVTLTARKSWFMLDGKIIALGADINSSDNRTIETIVDNRKLLKSGSNKYIVNGVEKPSVDKWSERLADVNWMWLENTGGYYFPKKTNMNALRENRTGSWSEINNGSRRDETNWFLTMWLDHGKSPKNATFEYVFLPNATAEATKKFSENPDFEILENSSKAQAIHDRASGVTAANFWMDGRYAVGGITASGTASVMVWDKSDKIEIAVSEPTWQNKTKLRVEINKTAGTVISAHERITVAQTSPSIILEVDLSGRPNGGAFTVALSK